MIYTIQIHAGNEKKMLDLCKSILPADIFKECFYLKQERLRKKNGKREIVTLPLFSGYLFVETDEIQEVIRYLHKVPEFTKLLGVGNEVIALSEEDVNFLKQGKEDHIFKMNKGRLVDGYVQIEEGAFEGFYGKLERLDRHNSYGIMRMNLFGREMNIEIGIMIFSQIEK